MSNKNRYLVHIGVRTGIVVEFVAMVYVYGTYALMFGGI